MKKFICEKAFTLIELLVVTAIIGILSTMVLFNYKSGQDQLTLQRGANKLAQDLRRAEEMAMAAEDKYGACTVGNFHYTYGVSFSTSNCNPSQPKDSCQDRYILYTDCVGNIMYQWSPYYDFILDSIDFYDKKPMLQVSELYTRNNMSDPFSSTNKLDIAFQPPDPAVLMNYPSSAVEGSIVISLKSDPTKTKTINVYKTGLIEIQ